MTSALSHIKYSFDSSAPNTFRTQHSIDYLWQLLKCYWYDPVYIFTLALQWNPINFLGNVIWVADEVLWCLKIIYRYIRMFFVFCNTNERKTEIWWLKWGQYSAIEFGQFQSNLIFRLKSIEFNRYQSKVNQHWSIGVKKGQTRWVDMCSDVKRIRFLPLTLIFTVRLFKYNTKCVCAMQIDVYLYIQQYH